MTSGKDFSIVSMISLWIVGAANSVPRIGNSNLTDKVLFFLIFGSMGPLDDVVSSEQ